MGEYGENTSSIYYDGYLDDYVTCQTAGVENISHVFIPVIYSLVFVVGILGNGLVMSVTLMFRNQATMADICVFNLALADMLFILTLPLYAHFEMVGRWVFGDAMCHLVGGACRTGFFSSIFFMVIMTMDRYALIMHGRRVASHRTKNVGVAIALMVWLLSVCVSLPTFVFSKVDDTECRFSPKDEAWEQYDLLTSNILGLLLPLLVMVFCYTRIVPVLVKMKSAKKLRVVKLIISVVVTFFVLWLPYNVCLVFLFLYNMKYLEETCDSQYQTWMSIVVTETLAFTHCCLNPFIYVFVGQKFRRRALVMLKTFLPQGRCSFRAQQSSRRSSLSSRTSETIVL